LRRRVAPAGTPGTRTAAASSGQAAQVARGVLRYGNAVDAVLAGVLAAAAESPTVLCGPLQMLVGGAGAGLVAFDGRVRQPGLGVPRPRGFTPDEPVPPSATVGVPALPATVTAAAALLGSLPLARAAGPAIELASARSPERARFIEAIVRRGARALADDAVAGELLVAAGRVARGLLTREDLSSVRPSVIQCDEGRTEPEGILMVSWRGQVRGDSSSTQVVAASDGQGLVAVACYEAPIDGLAIPALGVVVPPFAAPVRRGAARVRPGAARLATAPIALRTQGGIIDLALGIAEARDAEQSLDALIRGLAGAVAITDALFSGSEGRVVAIARSRDKARTIASG
jgi:hypothetical protein